MGKGKSKRRKPNRGQQEAGENLLLHLRFQSGDLLLDSSLHPNIVVQPTGATPPSQSYVIKTHNIGDGNKFYLDTSDPTTHNGTGHETPVVSLFENITYEFDISSNLNEGHKFRLSTDQDGIHEGGDQYTTNWKEVGTPGNEGAYIQFTPTSSTPSTLYYYCHNHAGMGGDGYFRKGQIKDVSLEADTVNFKSTTGSVHCHGSGCFFVVGSGEAHSHDLSLKKDFTIQFWSKQKETGYTDDQCMFDFGTLTGSVQSGEISYVAGATGVNGEVIHLVSRYEENYTGWNHFCIMRYNDTLNYYINGYFQSRVPFSDDIKFKKSSSSGYYHSIGGTRFLTNFFSGYIDDFVVHKLATYGMDGFTPVEEAESGKFPSLRKDGLTAELNRFANMYSTGTTAGIYPSSSYKIASGDRSHKLQHVFPREGSNLILSFYHEPDLANPQDHVVKFYFDAGTGEEEILSSDDTSKYLGDEIIGGTSSTHESYLDKYKLTTDLRNLPGGVEKHYLTGNLNKNGYHLIIESVSGDVEGTYSVRDWTAKRVYSAPRKVVLHNVAPIRPQIDCVTMDALSSTTLSGWRPGITGAFGLNETLSFNKKLSNFRYNGQQIDYLGSNYSPYWGNAGFHIGKSDSCFHTAAEPIKDIDGNILGWTDIADLPEDNATKKLFRRCFSTGESFMSNFGCVRCSEDPCNQFKISQTSKSYLLGPFPRYHIQKCYNAPNLILNSMILDSGLFANRPIDQSTGNFPNRNRVLTVTGDFNINTGIASGWKRDVVAHFSGSNCWLSVPRSMKYPRDHIHTGYLPNSHWTGIRHGISYPEDRSSFTNYFYNSSDNFDFGTGNFSIDLQINTDPSKVTDSGALFTYGSSGTMESGYGIYLLPSGSLGVYFHNPTGGTIDVDTNSRSIKEVTKDKWHHIFVRRTGMENNEGEIELFVGNEEDSELTKVWSGDHNGSIGIPTTRPSGFSFSSDYRLNLGRKEDTNSHYYSGYMCEFRMFDSGLESPLTFDLDERLHNGTNSETGKALKLLLHMRGYFEENETAGYYERSFGRNRHSISESGEMLSGSHNNGVFWDASDWQRGQIPYSGNLDCTGLALDVTITYPSQITTSQAGTTRIKPGKSQKFRYPYTSECIPDLSFNTSSSVYLATGLTGSVLSDRMTLQGCLAYSWNTEWVGHDGSKFLDRMPSGMINMPARTASHYLPTGEYLKATGVVVPAPHNTSVQFCVVDTVAEGKGIENKICKTVPMTTEFKTMWGGLPCIYAGNPVDPPTRPPISYPPNKDECKGIDDPVIRMATPSKDVVIRKGQSLRFIGDTIRGSGQWLLSDGSKIKSEKGQVLIGSSFTLKYNETGKFCYKFRSTNSCDAYAESNEACVTVKEPFPVRIIYPEK